MPANRLDSKAYVEWYQKEAIDFMRSITSREEERCAERLLRRVERLVPVGDYQTPGASNMAIALAFNAMPRRRKFISRQRIPGTLKRTIRKYASKFKKDGGYTVFAGDDVAYYALWVERGTGERFTRSGRYTGRGPARRFMRKAINEEKKVFIQNLEKVIL